MTKLIHAELLKLRTTRMLWWATAGMAATVGLAVATAILTAGGDTGHDLATAEGVRNVFSAAGAGTLIVLLLGNVVMTGERQHHTVTQTVLSTPARHRVVAAKMAATAMASAGLAVAASALTLLIALPWLTAESVKVAPLSGGVAGVLAGSIGATVLYGVIGVAVGAVVRSQLAAVALSLVWTLAVEALLVALLPKVGRWLPGGAADALGQVPTPRGGLLPVWGGAALLVAYVVGAALVGTRLFVEADVT